MLIQILLIFKSGRNAREDIFKSIMMQKEYFVVEFCT